MTADTPTIQPALADAAAPAQQPPAPAPAADAGALLEQVVVGGDLARLTPAQRLDYYRRVCDSLGLNPLTKPFDYLHLNGRLVLYATRTATDQLRANRGISVDITSREMLAEAGLYVVTARAVDRTGRSDEAVGAVSVLGLKGDALANALMKAETKAKRRATLSLAGLGWMDETEADAIPGARPARVDRETGELLEPHPLPAGAGEPPVELDRGQWEALGHALRANGLTKQQLVAYLDAELGPNRLGPAAKVREWFRRNPEADVISLVAEVYRFEQGEHDDPPAA
jgi:hypothetical protein